MRFRAFTLSEVLITITIIGIVAALTIPGLITKCAKLRTETKLKAFYSKINNALRLSSVDNGDIDGWVEQNKGYNYIETVAFLDQYLLPYIKYTDIKDCTTTQVGVCIHILDGSLFWFSIDANGADIVYYADGDRSHITPKNKFQFQFAKLSGIAGENSYKSVSFIEPYTFGWDGKVEHLKEGNIWACKKGCTNCGYCTKIIQLNSWKIPDNYPW